MQAQEFYKVVTMDHANLSERLITLFSEHQIAYCIIGGQAVNAYVEPLVSLDLDVVIATEQLPAVEALLAQSFTVQQFPHRINISVPNSGLRVQIQTDPRYAEFPARAVTREVLGMTLRVASIVDTLQGKIWAALDPTRRGCKFQKDLADITRLIERYPDLDALVPAELMKLIEMR